MRSVRATERACGSLLVAGLVGLTFSLVSTSALARDETTAPAERDVLFTLKVDSSPLEACGGEARLAGAVEERVHRSVFVDDAEEADITIAIAPEPDVGTETSWRALIIEKDRAGTELGRREVPLPKADCSKALDTLAVVLAIMLGSSRTTTDPPHRHEVIVEEPKVEPPHPPPPPRRVVHVPPPPPPRWMAGPVAGVVAGTGILPGLSWGVEAGVFVQPPVRRLSLFGRAAYWPQQTTGTTPPADVDRLGGAVLGCFELVRSGGLGLDACSGADVSRLKTRSVDLTRASETSVLVAVLGEARLGYRLAVRGNVSLEPVIAAQITALLRRDRFTYRDVTGRERTLLEPAPAAFQASFGVAVHFL